MMPSELPGQDPGQQDPQIAALIKALASMGGLQDQQGLLGQQQGQVADFMKPQGGQHTTGMGAAFGGLGDTIRSGVGAYRQSGLNDQQQGIAGQQGDARGQYMQALMRALGGGAPGGQASPLAPGAAPLP